MRLPLKAGTFFRVQVSFSHLFAPTKQSESLEQACLPAEVSYFLCATCTKEIGDVCLHAGKEQARTKRVIRHILIMAEKKTRKLHNYYEDDTFTAVKRDAVL